MHSHGATTAFESISDICVHAQPSITAAICNRSTTDWRSQWNSLRAPLELGRKGHESSEEHTNAQSLEETSSAIPSSPIQDISDLLMISHDQLLLEDELEVDEDVKAAFFQLVQPSLLPPL